MRISDLNIANWVQQLGSSALGSSSGVGSSSLFPATSAGQPTTGADGSSAAPMSAGTLGAQFAPQTLRALLSAQSDSFANQQAAGIISALNPGGSSLSLAQIESAVTGSDPASGGASTSSSTPTDAQIAQAFAQLDTNGDGQLSQGELATGLEEMRQRTQQGGFHHHHHYHPQQPNAAGASTGTTPADPLDSSVSTLA